MQTYQPTGNREEQSGVGEIRRRRESEASLWSRRDDDPLAREELVRRYLPFAATHANRYNSRTDSFDDLAQVASVGLINAVNRFDPSNGSAFAAFASPTINGELKRYFRDRVWLVRVPRGLQEEIHSVDKASAELSAELHRDPTPGEVAARANIDQRKVEEAILAKADRNPVSLDLEVDDDGQAPAVTVGSEDPGYGLFEDQDQIRSAVTGLDDTARLVLRLRFIEEMTQSEIADRIGYSQMHVSRLLRRSLEALASGSDPA